VIRVEDLGEQGLTVKIFGRVAPSTRFSAAGAFRRLLANEAQKAGVVVGWRSVSESAGPAKSGSARGSGSVRARKAAEEAALVQADSDPGV
jgi:hypothetical protein